jgi:hypothetical protein
MCEENGLVSTMHLVKVRTEDVCLEQRRSVREAGGREGVYGPAGEAAVEHVRQGRQLEADGVRPELCA